MSYFNNYYVMGTTNLQNSNAQNSEAGNSAMNNRNEAQLAILAKFASGQPLSDDELTTIGKIFAAQKETMAKAKQFASKKATEAEKAAEHAKLMQEHKLAVQNMVNDFVAEITNKEFTDSDDAKSVFKGFIFTLPKVPKMNGKGSKGSGNSRKAITDVKNLTEGSSNYLIWHAIVKAGNKGIDRKGLIDILHKAQPKRKLTLVKQAVSIGCNTLPVQCVNNMYTVR